MVRMLHLVPIEKHPTPRETQNPTTYPTCPLIKSRLRRGHHSDQNPSSHRQPSIDHPSTNHPTNIPTEGISLDLLQLFKRTRRKPWQWTPPTSKLFASTEFDLERQTYLFFGGNSRIAHLYKSEHATPSVRYQKVATPLLLDYYSRQRRNNQE